MARRCRLIAGSLVIAALSSAGTGLAVAAEGAPVSATTAAAALPLPPVTAMPSNPIEARLRQLVEQAPAVASDNADLTAALKRFYEARDYRTAWLGDEKRVAALTDVLSHAVDHGLVFAVPIAASASGKHALPPAERELMLTQLALRYASALAVGRVNPDRIEADWAIVPPAFDAAAGLEHALATADLAGWYAKLPPHHQAYERLKAALATYRDIAKAGGWEPVPRGQPLKLGMVDKRVKAIRRRLQVEGDLPAAPAPAAPPVEPTAPAAVSNAAAGPIVPVAATVGDPAAAIDPDEVFDATVEEGIRHFQARYGIAVDGAAGPRTIAAMNVPVRARIEQIELNLERWRSLPHDFGASYMLVNVPAESLEVVEGGKPVMGMKVVVGDPAHPTPVVRSNLVAVTFNPAWTIPASIIKNEITPKRQHDPNFLVKNHMVFTPGKGLQQLPGPKNPLGQIKFETPNRFDVYVHDTPSRSAFDHYLRAQSHGCVRAERARDLAVFVLQGLRWSDQQVDTAVASGQTQRVDLKRPWRVYMLYATSFVDADGTVEFRDDLYGRDKRLREALAASGGTAQAERGLRDGKRRATM